MNPIILSYFTMEGKVLSNYKKEYLKSGLMLNQMALVQSQHK